MECIEPSSDFINIALYHGQIKGWQNLSGYISDTWDKYIKDFLGMDYVLLGDIHRHQYISKEKPIMAYAGSLISQNFGETDLLHGILQWDLLFKNQIFFPIDNPYRYQDIYILSRTMLKTDLNTYSIEDIPISPKGNIRVFGMENEIESRSIFLSIKSKQKDARFTFKPYETTSTIDHDDIKKETENESITEYINQNISDILLREDIKYLLMKEWNENRFSTNFDWTLESLEFSNLFGYGKNNKIIFPFGSNIVSISGNNSFGKSSIIDIISLMFHDKITRYPHGLSIPNEVIHFDENHAWGKIRIKTGDCIYEIEKDFKRLSNHKIKLVTKFFTMKDSDSTRIELTDEQRNKTNHLIQQIVGDTKFFIYLRFFLQQEDSSFRNLASSTRKKFLYDLLGYSLFEKLEKIKKDELKELSIRKKIVMDNFEKTSDFFLENQIKSSESILLSINTDIKELKVEQSSIQKDINDKHISLSLITSDVTEEEILLLKKKMKDSEKIFQESSEYIQQWSNHFLLQYWNQYSEHPLFLKWKPQKNISKIKWDDFYSNCIEPVDIETIQTKLRNLYTQYDNSPISFDSSILKRFPVKNKKKLQIELDSLLTKFDETSFYKKYNELNFPIENINENFYHEYKQKFFYPLEQIETKIHEINKKLEIFQKYSDFIEKEDVPSFYTNILKYEHNELYSSYSKYFGNNYQSFLELLDKKNKMDLSSLQKLYNQLEKQKEILQSELPSLSPSLKIISSEEYKNLKNSLLKPPKETIFFPFEIQEIESISKQIDIIETNNKIIQYEINSSLEIIRDCEKDFTPNPNCTICLQNISHLKKISNQTKIKEKQREQSSNSLKLSFLYESLLEKMDIKDSLCSIFIHGEKTYDNLHAFIENKKKQIIDLQEKKKEYNYNLESIENYQAFQKKKEILKKIRKIDSEKELIQKDIELSILLLKEENILSSLSIEWKWRNILPKTLKEFKTLFENFSLHFIQVREELDSLSQTKINLDTQWNDFLNKWNSDKKIISEIRFLESLKEKKESLSLWFQEVLKFEKSKKLEKIHQEIQILHEKEQNFYHGKENRNLFDFLNRIWIDSSLWSIDGSSIQKEIKKYQDIIDSLSIHELKIELENKETIWKQIQKNKHLHSEISSLQIKLDSILYLLSKNENESFQEHCNLNSLFEKKQNRIIEKQNIQELEKEKNKLELLLKIIDKDGLPLYLLKEKIQPMENQINDLISPFLPNKQLKFIVHEKTIEFGSISNDSNKLCNYFGGMESFIVDLCLKLTFSKFGNIPHTNFFFIDERISVLDEERISNISYLFDFLKTLTSNVLLISHLPQIKDFVSKEMVIQKKNDKSFISFE